ncbi:MAG: helix-turn-helix domain-containing protein [Clostridia bacterium]|nr:helix-turn-helix domain-containing protein [Clostridia bacterium]
METYIDRIKQLKSQKKMTNELLAERSGIPLGTLSKVLAGMSDSPKLSTVVAICNALDCSLEYIVSGIPENTNNYTLSAEEIEFVESYRALDEWGRRAVQALTREESARVAAKEERGERIEGGTRILSPIPGGRYASLGRTRTGKRSISLYELPVSAGVGVYLDEARSESISIPNNDKTAEADYALRISGNSMEPKYHDGDVLLVQECESVEVGELGIFLLDGCGFFKIYDGDRLLSINPAYGPILLKDFESVQCKGRVIGRLKRK